jgi:glycosyltransferase involved in cell wall biosynthesis
MNSTATRDGAPAPRPGRTLRIAVVVPVLGERDAVATDARGMVAALSRQGHDVALFASGPVGGDARPLSELATISRDPAAVLIYHFGFGWPPGVDILRAARCRRIVRYHNVTPPQFFSRWSDEYERACRAGREEIRLIAELGCDLVLGDSRFNVDDFLAAGVPAGRTAVLPPFNRLDALLDTPADLALLERWRDGAANWLAVGRIAPNKGHLELLDAFALFLDRCTAEARLLLVGSVDARLARYAAALRERIDALAIGPRVEWLQDAGEGALKAAYLSADALVSLSGHEGFCVPLVEAMALGVPVVARDAGAQGATLGDAGLAWETPEPALVAASVQRLREDAGLRSLLRRRGEARVGRCYAPEVLEAGLARLVGAFA